MDNNYEISRFYFINSCINDMSNDVRKLNKIMTLHPENDYTVEIEGVKARLRQCMDDINELLEKKDESV